METINTKTDYQVLIPTGNNKYPFLIKTQDDRGVNCYWLVDTEGKFTGDGFDDSEKEKRYPQFLSNI